MVLFRSRVDQKAFLYESFVFEFLAGIWHDCVSFQKQIPQVQYFDTQEFFVEELIFQVHLLGRMAAKIAGRFEGKIMEAISKLAYGAIDQFLVEKDPGFDLRFKLLIAERQHQYFLLKWVSTFVVNDYPDPNLYAFSAGIFFSDPALRNKCVTFKKLGFRRNCALLAELLYKLNS